MLNSRYVARDVVRVRATRPRSEPIADSEGIGHRRSVLRARHAIPRGIVGVCSAAIRRKTVEVVVCIGLLGRLGHLGRLERIAERVGARGDAPDGVVLVFEAAEGRASRRAPCYVRHAVHDVVPIFYHKSVAVGSGRQPSVPFAVGEVERSGGGSKMRHLVVRDSWTVVRDTSSMCLSG